MKRAGNQPGKEALDLLEEAAHALRTASAGTLAAYYVGTLPFVLGGLYFWADMSRSPYAPQHMAGATLGMAALFGWMKFWQAVFARRVRAQVTGEPVPMLSWRRCGHVLLNQLALQPSGLFVLPLASVPLLPTAWVYAFYQNLTVLDDGESGELRSLFRKACRQATLWPKQNHLLLGLLLAFGLIVFLNWGMVCYLLPNLLKMLFGVESMFTRVSWRMLNTTFFAATFGLTYLCVDPIAKAAYALRCFYGESVQSGEDLKSGLREFMAPAQALTLGVVLLATGVCAGGSFPARAGQTAEAVETVNAGAGTALRRGVNESAAREETSISPPRLDATIKQVIQESRYAWRAPREKALSDKDADEGIIARFLDRVWELIKSGMKSVLKGLGKAFQWLGKLLDKLFGRFFRMPTPSTPGYGWVMSLHVLIYALVVGVILGLLYLAWRIWRSRRPKTAVITSEAILPVPDVADENVGADQLPEDGWIKLARELLARGELRLALRAFYLASLAHLAQRNLISIAKFKSNRDYERELRRRGHSFPEVLAMFGQNVTVFDSIWYGLHEVNPEVVNEFAGRVEQLKGGPAGSQTAGGAV